MGKKRSSGCKWTSRTMDKCSIHGQIRYLTPEKYDVLLTYKRALPIDSSYFKTETLLCVRTWLAVMSNVSPPIGSNLIGDFGSGWASGKPGTCLSLSPQSLSAQGKLFFSHYISTPTRRRSCRGRKGLGKSWHSFFWQRVRDFLLPLLECQHDFLAVENTAVYLSCFCFFPG